MTMRTPGLNNDARKLLIHIYAKHQGGEFDTTTLPEDLRKQNTSRLACREYIVRIGPKKSTTFKLTDSGLSYCKRFVSEEELANAV